MKILMATMKLDIGGAETHIVELSKELKRQGYDVIVASNGGVFEKELESVGIKHYKVPLHDKIPFHIVKSYHLLKKIILDEHVDIVHAHARIPAFILSKLHKKLNFPFVTTAHWVFSTKFPLNLLTNWGEKTISVSDDIKDYLIKNYDIPSDNINVTINGIDTEKFSPSVDTSGVIKEFNLKTDSYKIVSISRMDKDRADMAFYLTDLAQRLSKEIPNLEIVLVGGGNVYNELKAKADKVNAEIGRKVVTLTGPRADINNFAALSDIFVNVSRSALEAMACEKPVIIGGNEGYIGIFDEDKLKISFDTNFCCRGCPMADKETLFDDIMKIYSSPAEYKKHLGEFSRNTIKKYYSVTKMANDAIIAYQNCLRDHKYKYDVMLSGYYGYGNIGDETLLHAIIHNLKIKKPDIKIIVLTHKRDSFLDENNIDSISRTNIFKIRKYLKNTKLYVNGGGSLLQDSTSTKSLLYYLYLLNTAHKLGVKTYLYANGMGPFQKEKNILRVKKTLDKTYFITLRDKLSFDFVKSLNLKNQNIVLTSDEIFGINIPCKKNIDSKDDYMVISLRDWHKKDKSIYIKLSKLITNIHDMYNLKPVFILSKQNDLKITKILYDMIDIPSAEIHYDNSFEDIINTISKAKLVMSIRLHPLIFGLCADVPVYGISYDPKIAGILDLVEYPYYCDMYKFNIKKAMDKITNLLNNGISQEIKNSIASQKEYAKKNSDIAIKILNGEL